MDGAEEAEFILRLAELSPDDDDPAADHPGAKRESWRTEPEFPGVSEFFVHELAMILNVGRGTAAFRARRAFCWRDKLPATFAALKRGDVDERRGPGVFIVFGGVPADPARRGRPRAVRGGEQPFLPQPRAPGAGTPGEDHAHG